MAPIDDDDHSDSDSSSSDPEPNWDLLKETLGADALKALEAHMNNDDEGQPTTPSASRETVKLPKNNQEYGRQSYWDERFAEEEAFDWLVGYDDVEYLISPLLSPDSRILLVGCGNSNFSAEIYDAGYHNLTNIDYSEVVIDAMKKKYRESRPEMEWLVRVSSPRLLIAVRALPWEHAWIELSPSIACSRLRLLLLSTSCRSWI